MYVYCQSGKTSLPLTMKQFHFCVEFANGSTKRYKNQADKKEIASPKLVTSLSSETGLIFFSPPKPNAEIPKQPQINQEAVNRELTALLGINEYEGVRLKSGDEK